MTDTPFDDQSPTFWADLNSCCDRFEAAFKSGRSPRIEDYLKDVPETLRPFYLRELVRLEVYYRRRNGEQVAAEEYTYRFYHYRNILTIIGDAFSQSHSRNAPVETEVESTRPFGNRHPADPALLPNQDKTGQVIGNYRLTECIGRGGMGAVYRASHTLIDCERALKLLSPTLSGSAEAFQRFLLEAQATVGTLTHPNVVTTFDINRDGEVVYLVMELLDGSNLAEIVQRDGPFAPMRAAQIIEDAAKGLEAAHRRGLVHRDIKPHNIMLTTADVTKILDLGLVRIVDAADPHEEPNVERLANNLDGTVRRLHERLTEADAIMGTLAYMSPEQTQDARIADKQSDIYSLGCTFYFLVTGEHPFNADTPDALLKKKFDSNFRRPSEICRGLDESLQDIMLRMMDVSLADRYNSAELVARVLRAWQTSSRLINGEALNESMSFETRIELRDLLLQLNLVSEPDWQRAERRCQGTDWRGHHTTSVPDFEIGLTRIDRLDGEHTFSMPSGFKPDDPLPVLDELRILNQQSTDNLSGLSEFQVRQIMRGNADLLRLPDYVFLDRIGQGWKGEVFKARNCELNRLAAIRTFSLAALQGLPSNGDELEKLRAFHNAVQILESVQHDVFPTVIESNSFMSRFAGRVAYLVTQLVPGQSINDFVSSGLGRKTGSHQKWSIEAMATICDGLQVAHQMNVLHSDIHGKSLWIDEHGKCRLLDLGIGQLVIPKRHNKTTKGTANSELALSDAESVDGFDLSPTGTPHIMPPEQWRDRSDISVAVDIYNLGCVLFYLLSGRYPFAGKSVREMMQRHVSASPFDSEESKRIPAIVRPLISKMLAKNPGDRYPSASALAIDLRGITNHPSLN